MIKTSLKNFFTSMLYIFVPMGIVYLFVLLAMFGLAGASIGSAATMLGELSELLRDTVSESNFSVTEFISFAADRLTWDGNIFHYVGQIIDTGWVQSTVKEFFGSTTHITQDFTDIVMEFTSALKLQLTIAISTCVVGVVLANYATGFVVRRKNARRGFKRWIVANTVIPFVESLVLGGAFALAAEIRYYALLAFAVVILAYGFLALVSSWIVYKDKSLPFKEVVNTKNLLGQIASVAVIFLLVVAVFFLVSILNFILAALVILPVVIYAINLIRVNTDSYVLSLLAKKSAQEETEPETKE